MTTRTFHFTEGSSSKFWAISLDGNSHTVQWGRIGTNGQTQTKEFASEEAAHTSYEKLVAEKVKKGYIEQGVAAGAVAPKSSPATPQAAPEQPRVETARLTDPGIEGRRQKAEGSPLGTRNSELGTENSEPGGPRVETARLTDQSPPARTPNADLGNGSSELGARNSEPGFPNPNLHPYPHRELGLRPEDWFWATWRDLDPLSTREPAPFDQAAACAKVAKTPRQQYGWDWEWDKVDPPRFMTREEAHFWLVAMTQANRLKTPKELAEHLSKQTFAGDLSVEDVLQRIEKAQGVPSPEAYLVLANLLPPRTLVEKLLEYEVSAKANAGRSHSANRNVDAWVATLADGFRRYGVPYLTRDERRELRELIQQRITPSLWPTSHYDGVPAVIRFGAYLGCHEAIRAVVESLRDDFYTGEDWSDHYHRPQEILFGLGDPQLVQAEMHRLKLRIVQENHIRGWLAHTEYSALDHVRRSLQTIGNKDEAAAAVQLFAMVRAPELAPEMVELMLHSKAPKVAKEWLEANPGFVIPGLMPLAAGRGRAAEAALEHLRSLRRRGQEAALVAALEPQTPEVADRIRTLVIDYREKVYTPFDETSTPDWLRDVLPTVEKKLRPLWFATEDLPPVTVGEYRLAESQVSALLAALQQSKIDAPHPLVTAVRAHADRSALDTLAWRLFELWLTEGGPAKENWAMAAIGLLGSDASALKLTPLVRAWPGESQHQRAVLGLECLRSIGTDTALMQINGIAQKLKFKGLKTKAAECMEAIAKDRGFTRAELEDRIVPDCDLDERGSRVFDFGPRQFRFVLGPGMKPMVKEADGKVRPDLPRPNSKDDEALATAAVEEWKLLKKIVSEVVKIQVVRLEQAMVTGRRWTPEEFETLLVRHPLMVNLVRLLVWGAYDAEGRLTGTFRITEDQSLADEHDEPFELTGAAAVGIVHPLHLSDEQRRAWGELLSDYEIVPPFPQLGRGLFSLEPGEAEQTVLERFNQGQIPATALVGTLERLAWIRGIPEDGGVFYEHSKPFYGANVTAIVQYEDGVPVGYMEGWEDQTLSGCFFVPGIYNADIYPDHNQKLKLGDIDPVVLSEVLSDLTVVHSKAK